jgi:hypothetical protein
VRLFLLAVRGAASSVVGLTTTIARVARRPADIYARERGNRERTSAVTWGPSIFGVGPVYLEGGERGNSH